MLIQLPPSFTVSDFKKIEGFLDRLPSSSSSNSSSGHYDYAVEFRHPSWSIEGPWDMLRHYNIAAVMTDSPARENLQFLSDVTILLLTIHLLGFMEEIQKIVTDITIYIAKKN
ncbi:MAG TPA: DUF72 domain-containing protein [Nitrososphaeraceae archaeon]|nr:DUF72 domain-containing protein [Nitrososphaeraceae archaeon]